MGRSWIQGYKNLQASKKGNLFTKLSKEITVAARLGGGDPSGNARLRAAVEEARANSMPRENIERAVKKGAGTLEGVSYEDVIYEGYGPFGVAIMVEALTDNRNRTVSELKTIFKNHGGNLGEMGSVAWMFEKCGFVEAKKDKLPDDLEGEAIEVNAQAVEGLGDDLASFTTDVQDLDAVKKALEERKWQIQSAQIGFLPKTPVELSGGDKQTVIELLSDLGGHDDVRKVHTALA
jgi:YebC/PmpR family DNA-binding regulatory protein